MERKSKPRKEHGMLKDITIGDTELGNEDEEIKVLECGVELSAEETEYMKLPNSMMDFAPVDVESIKTGIQAMGAILRMSVREAEDNSSQGMDAHEEEAVMASMRAYDSEQQQADFRKKKVTYSKLNKKIKVPLPVAP